MVTYSVPRNNSDELYDLDGVSYDFYRKSACKGYQLDQFERDSIREISRKINKDQYYDAVSVESHLHYLEDMIQRIRSILRLEEQSGITNMRLRRDLAQVELHYRKLSNHLKKLHKDNWK